LGANTSAAATKLHSQSLYGKKSYETATPTSVYIKKHSKRPQHVVHLTITRLLLGLGRRSVQSRTRACAAPVACISPPAQETSKAEAYHTNTTLTPWCCCTSRWARWKAADCCICGALRARGPPPAAVLHLLRVPPSPPTKPHHVQNSDQDQFLFDTPVARTSGDVAADLAALHNLRHRIMRLRLEGGELARYGPAKRPDQQGIDTFEEGAAGRERGPHYCMDPTGRRTGEGGLLGLGCME